MSRPLVRLLTLGSALVLAMLATKDAEAQASFVQDAPVLNLLEINTSNPASLSFRQRGRTNIVKSWMSGDVSALSISQEGNTGEIDAVFTGDTNAFDGQQDLGKTVSSKSRKSKIIRGVTNGAFVMVFTSGNFSWGKVGDSITGGRLMRMH